MTELAKEHDTPGHIEAMSTIQRQELADWIKILSSLYLRGLRAAAVVFLDPQGHAEVLASPRVESVSEFLLSVAESLEEELARDYEPSWDH